ncbi:hypothetical protein GCM10023080_096250 [Streptomyces pseudoechinosporeus]
MSGQGLDKEEAAAGLGVGRGWFERAEGGRAAVGAGIREFDTERGVGVCVVEREDNAGLGGPFHLLRLKEGTTVGHNEVQLTSRLISDSKEVQILELRYGIIRAQALPPRESLAFRPQDWAAFVSYAADH